MGVLGRDDISVDINIGLGEKLPEVPELLVGIGAGVRVISPLLSELRWGFGGYGAGGITDDEGGVSFRVLGKIGVDKVEFVGNGEGKWEITKFREEAIVRIAEMRSERMHDHGCRERKCKRRRRWRSCGQESSSRKDLKCRRFRFFPFPSGIRTGESYTMS